MSTEQRRAMIVAAALPLVAEYRSQVEMVKSALRAQLVSEGFEAASYPSAAATQPAQPAERNTARLHRARCRLHRPPLHS